jgi:cytochrome c oxidase subunit 2
MPPIFPEQASTIAGQIDTLYFVLIALALAFAVPIPLIILYFIIKYHRSTNANRSNLLISSLKIELAWSIGPLILALGVFFWSASIYADVYGQEPPATDVGTVEIYMVGKQWMWKAQHPQGRRENNTLHVPVGVPVRLIMTSQDVIHSFYVPAFRIKRDVLPGRYTTTWFEATQVGEYHLFCAEYCGTDHSRMRGTVVVMEVDAYQRWLRDQPEPILENTAPPPDSDVLTDTVISAAQEPGSMAAQGEQIFRQQECHSCHASDGSGVGPSLVGLYGSRIQFQTGEVITADENYIRTSILEPQERVLPGYPPVMPTYAGQLSEDELMQLLAYLKALSSGSQAEPPERNSE